jgi:hypothetical protein
MTVRVPALMRTLTAITAGLFVLTSALTAQPPSAPASPGAAPAATPASQDELKAKQENIKKNFQQFKEVLFRLATRLEKSDRQEAKDQAKVIRTALESAEKQGVDGQFSKLVTGIAAAKSGFDYEKLTEEDKQLLKMLNEIMAILQTDDETARLREERMKIEAFLKELKAIKNKQENLQVRTESKVGNKERLGDEQKDLKDQTQDIAKRLGGDKKDGQGEGKKDDRAEPKSDPKAGEQTGEPKADTGEAKGDAKEGKEGSASEGKGGEPKDAAGDSKSGPDAKEGEKAGEGKPAAQDSKPTDGKPSDSQGGQGKGQGDGKGEGKGSKGEGGEGKGSGKPAGQPSDGQGGSKSGGQPGQPGGGPPPPPAQPSNQMPGRKEVQEAVPQQQQAKDNIEKDKRPEAGKNQDNAIEKLQAAIKELEKRLKQLREEEMKKLLANVEARCNKMLMMQIEVYENTKSIDNNVSKNGGQKGTADIQKSQQQSDKEGEIVAEAERCLKLLESEGSAVAFAKVLEEVRQDMIAVQRRLGSAVVDKDTQTIEENIIALLKDMIEALKKAQAEIGKDPPPPPGGQSKPPNQKLISLLNELRLIRTLQAQVNMRTKMYGEKEKIEQAKDPIIQAELRQLSVRQQKLEEMIEKLANGENQ